MGSRLRGGAATDVTFLGVPFAKGAGGACIDHVGMVNWEPGARSGVVPATLIVSACRSARDVEFGRATLRWGEWMLKVRKLMKISGIQMTKPTTIIEKSIDRYFLTEYHSLYIQI